MVSPLVADLLRGGRELRAAQVEMAMQVQRALIEAVPAVIEAPTGIGKSHAYLVPAIRSGRTIVISTANKALQEQLFTKDIPFLQAHLQPFGVAMLKGVGNYVCLDRLHEARKDLRNFDRFGEFQQLIDAVEHDGAFRGDFETLGFVLPTELRGRVNGDSDQCAWSKCDWFDDCYIRSMRDRARNAQVIIVNHTLLLLDAWADNAIIPPHDVVVIDEAHHLADEATSAFTFTVRPTQVSSLLQLRAVQAHTPPPLSREVMQLSAQLWSRIEQTSFGTTGKVTFRQPIDEALQLATKLAEMADALRVLRPHEQSEKEAALYDKVIARTLNLANNLRLVFAVEKGQYVHYMERVLTGSQRFPSFQVCAAPLDVAPLLREKLFDKKNIVILTSATLATVGPNAAKPEENGRPNFAYFRKQIGLDMARADVIERILPHVFDYRHHALLYVPRDLPEPAYVGQPAEHYGRLIAERMKRLVLASRGRAFLLFSSRRMLDDVYARIAADLPFTVLRQGEMNRPDLIKRFRAEGAVLFGLKTFWEGVDIAGEALSLVVIDRLPFAPPDDPIHEAIVNGMKARGENWFGTYVLPQVVLSLKQGVGRLLRTHEDRGVMAILDARLYTKGYGKEVLNALPGATRTAQLADVERFFAQA
jgi:Rad3-related DNA helicase